VDIPEIRDTDCLGTGRLAAIAAFGRGSLAGWKLCLRLAGSVTAMNASRDRPQRS
jgi:hypothetical protein